MACTLQFLKLPELMKTRQRCADVTTSAAPQYFHGRGSAGPGGGVGVTQAGLQLFCPEQMARRARATLALQSDPRAGQRSIGEASVYTVPLMVYHSWANVAKLRNRPSVEVALSSAALLSDEANGSVASIAICRGAPKVLPRRRSVRPESTFARRTAWRSSEPHPTEAAEPVAEEEGASAHCGGEDVVRGFEDRGVDGERGAEAESVRAGLEIAQLGPERVSYF
ncbi:hypothetical protein H4582DRAFT_2054012 [Lactarius indigo]|nr:hypothetical protein H4582DRAFT_2054012 [Lactarius indigo]